MHLPLTGGAHQVMKGTPSCETTAAYLRSFSQATTGIPLRLQNARAQGLHQALQACPRLKLFRGHNML